MTVSFDTYYLINELKLPLDFPLNQGIYFIHWIKSDKFVSLSRLFEIDTSGLLYVGKSTNLKKRLNDLIENINNPSLLKHHFGIKFNKTDKFRQKIPISELALIIQPSDNPKDSEEKYLLCYNSKFGELPPFNSNF